jgi:hypothetical protein
LKRGWTKFSPCISAAFAIVLISTAGLAQNAAPPKPLGELTLAGLQPGKDSLAAALKRYKDKYSSSDAGGAAEKISGKPAGKPSGRQWSDACTGHTLSLTMDARGVIQGITVSSLVPLDGKCVDRRTDALDEKDWVTGRGLHLGDPQDRVAELYGEPDTSGPSVRNNNELEFLFYPFAGAASDAPQAMEIYCARDTGRVVEITLAHPGL